MKDFIEQMRANLRWLGVGGEGPSWVIWEIPLYALMLVWYAVTFIWVNTVVRVVNFIKGIFPPWMVH